MARRDPSLAAALALSLALAAAAGCEEGENFFFDDDPVASGRWTAELVDDPGAGGHVDLGFRGVFDPGDLASDELIEIRVFVDSGDEAVSFELDEDSGWDLTQRLGTLTVHADYDEDDERVAIDARLTARDDDPRRMEASVEYRLRYFSSHDERFQREYVWREDVEF